MKSKLNPAEVLEMKLAQHLTNTEIALKLETSEASVRRALTKAGYGPHFLKPSFVDQATALLDAPIILNTEDIGGIAVTADWHHPLTNYELVNEFIAQSRDMRIRNTLLVAGDWFNMDALSAYSPKQTRGADLVTELAASQETVGALLETFQRIVITKGNHDWRLVRALGFQLEFIDSMRLLFPDLSAKDLARIEFSNLDHAWIYTPNGPWYVGHPKVYNKVALNTARELASIKRTPSGESPHVITGHSHHTAVGFDKSGTRVVAEIGGFFDVSKTNYLLDTTTYPTWTNGYGFIDRHGHFTLESPTFSFRR